MSFMGNFKCRNSDWDGEESCNLKLSKDRADAVRNKLIQMGIASSRLTSEGCVMIMDKRMPIINGIETFIEIFKYMIKLKSCFFNLYDREDYVATALKLPTERLLNC